MKKFVTLALAGIMALSLTACGSKGTGGSGKGNVLTVGCVELNGTFSPLYSSTVYDGYVVDMVYEKLLSFDLNNQMAPELAESYEMSKDGKEVTFKLRKDAVFSDGTPLTAKDVEFTFKVLSDPSYSGRYPNVVAPLVGYEDYHNKDNKSEPKYPGIEVVDDYTIKFKFSKVKNDNLVNLATTCGIISYNQFKDTYKYKNTKPIEEAIQKPMGTGPYVLKDWQKGSGASFEKNPEYKGDGYAIEKVIIKPVEQTTQLQELTEGNIDLLPNMASPKTVGPASNDKNLTFNRFTGSAVAYLALNNANGATADKAVRKALAYAFDRESLNNSYFECKDCSFKESIAYTPTTLNNPISAIGDVVTGKEKLDGLDPYPYDIEKAKKVLDDAGWKMGSDGVRAKDGQKLTVKYLATKDSGYVDAIVNVLNKDWKQTLGVDLQVATVDFNTVVDKITSEASLNEWNMFSIGVSFTTDSMADLLTMIHSDFIGDQMDNYVHLNDPKLDDLLDKALAEVDAAKSADYWKQACIQLNDDAAYIPTYGNDVFDLYNKRIKNLKTSALHLWPAALKEATIE